jgi:ribosomal protein S18 acetylase RimI-like enzyme
MSARTATPDDVDALVHLINRAYLVEAHIFHGPRTDATEILERLGTPNACFFVIDDAEPGARHGALAGAVYVETHGERSYFGMLSVDPDRQGRGFGRELVTVAEAHGSASGSAFMDIDVVDQRPELPGFYAALGYTPTGVATPYPNTAVTKVPVKMIHMTKALAAR